MPDPQIVFLAHRYLHVMPPVAAAQKVALRIVDEEGALSLLRQSLYG